MVSRIGSTHRLGAQKEDVSAFQNSTHTQAIPEINTDYLISHSRTEEYTSFLRARYRLPQTGSAMENGSHGHGFRTERYGLFRTITGFPTLRDARGILCRGRVNHTAQSLYMLRQSGGMEEESPSRLILVILSACTRDDTCHPWNCMCSISLHPFFTLSLSKT
jgi:hypothetical protein